MFYELYFEAHIFEIGKNIVLSDAVTLIGKKILH